METNIDERLVKWDSILKEIVVDVKELNKDLHEGIKYILGAGILATALGIVVLFFTIRYTTIQDPLLWVLLAFTTGSTLIMGFYNIHKYFLLKRKYSRLIELEMNLTG